jgi:hypothetical protein
LPNEGGEYVKLFGNRIGEKRSIHNASN